MRAFGGITIWTICLVLAGCSTGIIDIEIPIDDKSWTLSTNADEALVDDQHSEYGTYPNPRQVRWMKVMLNDDGNLCAYDGEKQWCGGPITGIPYRTVVNIQETSWCAKVLDIYGNKVREGCTDGEPPESLFSANNGDLPQESGTIVEGPQNVHTVAQDGFMLGMTLTISAINQGLEKMGLKSRVSVPDTSDLQDFDQGDITISSGTCKDVLDYLDSEFSDDHPGTDDYVFGPEAIAQCLNQGECRIGQLITRSMAQACQELSGEEHSYSTEGIIHAAGSGKTQLCDEGNAEVDKCVGSPLVLDLAGDGLQLQGPAVSFPLVASQSMTVGWLAGSDDALLAVDLDGDGKITNGRELFGEATGGWAPHGFAALARYDENKDGVISASDSIFERLVAWRDDGDARSERGELLPLADLGIRSISLKATRSDREDTFGNQLGLIGSASTEGTKRIPLIDVWFRMETASPR